MRRIRNLQGASRAMAGSRDADAPSNLALPA